jgi:hypothetical protein
VGANLAKAFATAACPVAAFEIAATFKNGVYEKSLVAALDLFYRLPCPETAAILSLVKPELGPVIAGTTSFALTFGSPGHRGAALQGIDEYLAEATARLALTEKIRQFVWTHARSGIVRVGFHRTRNQAEVLRRLQAIGQSKGILRNPRQWMRDQVTGGPAAWRACADLICLHGVVIGSELFWNALGASEQPSCYLSSEILFDLGSVAPKMSQFTATH